MAQQKGTDSSVSVVNGRNEGGRTGREFLMLAPAGIGLSLRMQSRGYVKIDNLGDTGRYECYIQNADKIGSDGSNIVYSLYFARVRQNKADVSAFVHAGEFKPSNAGFVINGQFRTADFLCSGIDANDLDIVAVTVRRGGNKPAVCLAAVRGKPYPSWREDICSVFAEFIARPVNIDMPKEIFEMSGVSGTQETPQAPVPDKMLQIPEMTDTPETYEIPGMTEQFDMDVSPAAEPDVLEKPFSSYVPEDQADNEESPEAHSAHDTDFLAGNAEEEGARIGVLPTESVEYSAGAAGSGTDAGFITPTVESLVSVTDDAGVDAREKSSFESLVDALDNNFKRTNPFRMRRRDYRWWKIDNPAHLNNILYENGLRISLLFNPDLVMSHYRHQYLIAGTFTDRVKRRNYFVCGVPAEWKPNDKPFGEFGRWVHPDTSRVRIGSLGYWLIYVDMATGKYLSF